MSRPWLEDLKNAVQTIFLVLSIILAVYAVLSQIAAEFWRGFAVGALTIFFVMLAYHLYSTREEKMKKAQMAESAGSAAESAQRTSK